MNFLSTSFWHWHVCSFKIGCFFVCHVAKLSTFLMASFSWWSSFCSLRVKLFFCCCFLCCWTSVLREQQQKKKLRCSEQNDDHGENDAVKNVDKFATWKTRMNNCKRMKMALSQQSWQKIYQWDSTCLARAVSEKKKKSCNVCEQKVNKQLQISKCFDLRDQLKKDGS